MDTVLIPPCPENWESCLTCGAAPNETCRDPDVTEGNRMSFKGMYAQETLSLGTVASLRPQEGPRDVIGITGYKGSGKDTFAEVVAKVLGRDKVAVVKFADCLKNMLRSMLMYAGADAVTIEECVEGGLKEVPAPPLNGATPRHAMVTLGTEWGRELIDENIWADLTKRHIQSNPDLAGKLVLVTDVRFPNEAEVIAELGGLLIRVNRPDLCPDRTHASERSIDALKAQEVFNNTNKEAFLREAAGWAFSRYLLED